MTESIVHHPPAETQAQARLPLARRRAAFDVIHAQFALRYRACRHIQNPTARAERQRELVEQIARFRAQLLPESSVTVGGGAS